MLFKIDFTRPHLYEDTVTLNQGNLSTNNTLRCRIATGGNDDVTGASIVCTFVINGKQIFESGKVVDGPRGIVDVIFPSEALVVGENTLEFLVNRVDGSVAQSPVIKYRVWQGLTTDEGVRADSNYPLLVELINQANSAVNSANEALEGANSVIAQGDELKASVDKLKADCIASVNSFTEENSAKIDNAISQNVAKVDAAIVKSETSVVKADAATEKAILAANNSDTKTAENIKNVNAAIAAGTQDLEVKAARVDMVGVDHGSLKERLNSDFSIGDRSLKDYVIDLDNMKESQDFAYETDKGYLVCKDTQNGVVKDLKIYGKSLVNKSKIKTTSFEGRIINLFSDSILNGFTIITDTIKNTASKGIAISITDINGVVTYPLIQKPNTTGKSVWFFDKQVKEISIYLQLDDYGADKATVDNIMILEGDHRSNLPNGYFEGIASVGNGNEIEVLSSSKNIANDIVVGYVGESGEMIESPNSNRLNMTRVIPNTKYIFSKDGAPRNCNKFFYDAKGNYICKDISSGTNPIFTTSNNCYYVVLVWGSSQELGKYQLEIGDTVTSYAEPKQDKKTILFKDADNTWKPIVNLRGIDENNCDIIDSVKNVFNQKYFEDIIDGSQTITKGTTVDDTTGFTIKLSNRTLDNSNSIICDKYTVNTNCYSQPIEGVFGAGLNIFIRVKSSKASTVEQLKTYLQTNNFSVVFPLYEPKSYEINPIYTDSYDNETMISIDSGAIAPYASWKITSSLPNFVQNIEDRVCRLENDAYKVNLANFTVALNMLDMKARLESLEAPIN